MASGVSAGIAMLLLLSLIFSASGCSVFLLSDGNTSFVGRSFDWLSDYGIVRADSPGMEKTALYVQDPQVPARWTSKYRTLTIEGGLIVTRDYGNLTTQTDGINEKGLYAAGLWINPPPSVRYPMPDGRPALTPPMVVPYILDNFATVAEALAGFNSVQVTGLNTDATPIAQHWFIADRSGDSAIIEYPDGTLSILHPANPPVMTNHFQVWGRNQCRNYTGWGGSIPLPYGEKRTSLNRFLVAADMVEKGREEKNVTASFVFSILGSVAQEEGALYHYSSGSLTQWSVVYDLRNRTMEWYMHGNSTRFLVTMDSIPFCAGAKTRTIPLRSTKGGDVSDLIPRC